MNAPAQQPKLTPDPGPTTYFLLSHDEHDELAAREFLTNKYGEGTTKTAKRVTEIRIGRLTEEHRVVCVVRKNILQGLKRVVDPESKRARAYREDMLLGIAECEPVECADFWVPSSDADGDGVLDMPRFLEAVGKACTPMAPRYRPDDQKLRLLHT